MLNPARSDATAAIIPLEGRRPPLRSRSRQAMKAAAIFALCLLGLIGSFADSAVARSGFLLIGSADNVDPGSIDSLATTLIYATIANLAACAAVVILIYWLLSRPTAQIVELRPRRAKP